METFEVQLNLEVEFVLVDMFKLARVINEMTEVFDCIFHFPDIRDDKSANNGSHYIQKEPHDLE